MCPRLCLNSHHCQRVVGTVWRPHLHSSYFPFVKRVVVTLRMGCAHLCALGATERSLAWPIWGGDVEGRKEGRKEEVYCYQRRIAVRSAHGEWVNTNHRIENRFEMTAGRHEGQGPEDVIRGPN